MAKFPKRLFVKIEKADGESYFVADTSANGMVEAGEHIPVAVYELVGTGSLSAEVKAEIDQPIKRRRAR